MLCNFVTQNAEIVLQFRPRLLLYIFFPIHYLRIVLFVTLCSLMYSQQLFIAHEEIQNQIYKMCIVGINVSGGAAIFAKFWTYSGSHPETHSIGTVSKPQENEYAFVPPFPNRRLRGVLPPIQLLFTHRWPCYYRPWRSFALYYRGSELKPRTEGWLFSIMHNVYYSVPPGEMSRQYMKKVYYRFLSHSFKLCLLTILLFDAPKTKTYRIFVT
jgi:hypothetical protein